MTYGPGDRLGLGAQPVAPAGAGVARLPAAGGAAPPVDDGRVAILGALP